MSWFTTNNENSKKNVNLKWHAPKNYDASQSVVAAIMTLNDSTDFVKLVVNPKKSIFRFDNAF